MVAMTVCNRLAPVAAVGYGRPARRHGASGQTSVSCEPSGRGGRTSGPEQSWLIALPVSVGWAEGASVESVRGCAKQLAVIRRRSSRAAPGDDAAGGGSESQADATPADSADSQRK